MRDKISNFILVVQVYSLKYEYGYLRLYDMGKLTNAVRTIADRLHHPLHIEFNLTDFCNLNCKGCSHYSPLAPMEFQTLDDLEASMKKVSEAKNSRKIEGVFLIGGETLLYPHVPEAMKLARKYFQWAKISLFTNGLLIPRMDERFWQICRDMDIVLAITRYPIKFDYDKAEQICREKGVKTEIFSDRGLKESFYKFPLDSEKRQRPWLSHFRCSAFGCITIDNGRIFPCSLSACVGHLNRRFGTDFKWEKGDYIDVEKLKDISEILHLRNRPVPFCGYCKRFTFTEFGHSKRIKEEWV